ncbi:hypothetical protein [Shimia sp. SDUM112013]|uniref:hypothetical protein n=1 Tax=Shimia sp. SDUM112013 TaxID=3136160 RepID=UPI0032F05354
MKINSTGAVIAALSLGASGVTAQESSAFTWEGEIEVGSASILKSDIAANEATDNYLVAEFLANLHLSDTFSLFGGLTIESGLDPFYNGHGTWEGIGAYIHELGVQIDLNSTSIVVGKVHPEFGTAWDDTAGFFSGAIAEDYELAEQIGFLADFGLGDGSMLSFSVFYADDTVLSESAFNNRGRNTTAAGGAGNTGQLDNVSVQWTKTFDDTRFHIGARHLSAGTGDVKDEQGVIAGLSHSFANGLFVYGEAAMFTGFGGTADDANYVTLNAAYGVGQTTFSGALVRRDIESAGVTNLATLGVEYEFDSGITLGGALAWMDDAGTDETLFGLNVIIPIGG